MKLAPGIRHEQANAVLSGTPGCRAVIQLFPDEPDQDMRSMYILEVSADRLEEAMKQLRLNPSVESAHETPSRKLIR